MTTISPVSTPPPPLIRPGATALVRDGNRVQLGCDPDRSIILDLAPPMTAALVTHILTYLSEPRTSGELKRYLRCQGMTKTDFDSLAEQFVAAGIVSEPGTSSISRLKMRIHGRGPIADRLSDSLRDVGARVVESAIRPRDGQVGRWSQTQLAILTDTATHDPVTVRTLMQLRIPHLVVHVRDGVGVVGPLVLPGLSSCLRCADRHRTTLDPQWPLLAAQLIGKSGYAGPAVIRATVALAHEQIEQIASGIDATDVASHCPDLINHTLEFHTGPIRLRRKHWPPHPSCGCTAVSL